MKKFSKILCAVLLVALIVSTVAIIVSADTPTPTMTVTSTTTASADVAAMLEATKSTADGNLNLKLAWAASGNSTNPNDLMKSYIVDTGSDKFVGLYAPASKSGIHMQYTMSAPTAEMTKFTNQHFYVVELDVATQSTFPTGATVSITHRRVTGDKTDMMANQVSITKYSGSFTAGTWKHITIVGQIDIAFDADGNVVVADSINHQHVFVDGVYVGTQVGAYNSAQLTNGVTPESYDEGKGLYAQGFKVDVSGSAGVNAGESMLFDNFYRRDMTKAEAEANGLATIVAAKGDISTWGGYPESSKSGQKLPAFVKVDGVEYNNATLASAVLVGNDAHEIEFLGENIANLSISTEATVKTNGFNASFTAPNGAKIVETAPGVYKITPPTQ